MTDVNRAIDEMNEEKAEAPVGAAANAQAMKIDPSQAVPGSQTTPIDSNPAVPSAGK